MTKIGDQVDSSGVEMEMEDGDLVSGFVVMARIACHDGGEAVRVGWSDGLGWVARRGMIEAARDVERLGDRDFEDVGDEE